MKVLLTLILISTSTAFADSKVDSLLDWGNQFRAKYGNELKGQTPDGKACVLSVYDQSFDGDSSCGHINQREAYISLGTSSDGTTSPGSNTYIGFKINPDCTHAPPYAVKAIDITAESINIDILSDEFPPSGTENNLVIKMDAQGNVTQVQGSSSHWPSSICLFK